MKYTCQQISNQRHNGKLTHDTHKNSFSHGSNIGKVFYAHLSTHSKHHQLNHKENQPFVSQVEITPL